MAWIWVDEFEFRSANEILPQYYFAGLSWMQPVSDLSARQLPLRPLQVNEQIARRARAD